MPYTATEPEVDVPPGVEAIVRDDWDELTDPCPECDWSSFIVRHLAGDIWSSREVETSDGSTRQHASPINDLDGHNQLLFAKCRHCGEVVYKHPAADLLPEIDPTA